MSKWEKSKSNAEWYTRKCGDFFSLWASTGGDWQLCDPDGEAWNDGNEPSLQAAKAAAETALRSFLEEALRGLGDI